MSVIQNNRRVNIAEVLNEFSQSAILYNTLDLSFDEGYLLGYRYSGILTQVKIDSDFSTNLIFSVITAKGRRFEVASISSLNAQQSLEGIEALKLVIGYGSRLIVESTRPIPPGRAVAVFGAIDELGFPAITGIDSGLIWGNIVGNPEDQADLRILLEAKQDAIEFEEFAADTDESISSIDENIEAIEASITNTQDSITQLGQSLTNQIQSGLSNLSNALQPQIDELEAVDLLFQSRSNEILGIWSETEPQNRVDGLKWREIPHNAPLLPWVWIWSSAANRWLSDQAWVSFPASGRLQGNDSSSSFSANLPPYFNVWVESAYLRYTKNASPYTFRVQRILNHTNATGTDLLNLALPSGAQNTPANLSISVNQELGNIVGLDWRMTVAPGQPSESRFSLNLVMRVFR